VPERILAEFDMGSGDDEARGHSGVAKMIGGPGKDLLPGLTAKTGSRATAARTRSAAARAATR
jgi:hypothetical protein